MTENEYLEKRREINERHMNDIYNLELEYCISKTPYGVGDIVEDDISTVCITEISDVDASINDYNRTKIGLVFKGVEVKKTDFTPKKNTGERDVYESKIEKILEKYNEE